MTKSEFLKALEGVKDITECQFQALADVLSGKSVAAPKVAEQPKVEEPKVAAEQPKVEAPKVEMWPRRLRPSSPRKSRSPI
jgi:hypothetical protein